MSMTLTTPCMAADVMPVVGGFDIRRVARDVAFTLVADEGDGDRRWTLPHPVEPQVEHRRPRLRIHSKRVRYRIPFR